MNGKPLAIAASTALATLAPILAQDDAPPGLSWPEDRGRAICEVDGQKYSLAELVAHLDERHFHGMTKLMDTVTGQGYLSHPLLSQWARQFADIKALERAAKEAEIDFAKAKPALSAALKREFESHLDRYAKERARLGRPLELTQRRVDLLLDDFQRENGMRTEVQGWLDAIVPEISNEETGRLRSWFNEHIAFFCGAVDVAQIVVYDRDPHTLLRLEGKPLRKAQDRLKEIQSRLSKENADFQDIARELSDDRRSAREGGVLRGIERFDRRLPAIMCRKAWALLDDEVSEPFETPYGTVILKRLNYQTKVYVLFTDAVKPKVAQLIRQSDQENALFTARKKFKVQLFL